MMPKKLVKEIARDTLALGSIPFYIIVLGRALIGRYLPFVYQLVIAVAVLFILSWFIKKSHQHIARGFILVVFTSLFYKAPIYTLFAVVLWLLMVFSAVYLKSKRQEITKGIVLGLICSAVSYFLTAFVLRIV